MKQIILASTSPRRKEILGMLGLKFKVVASRFKEDMSLPMSPVKLVQFLAEGKAKEVAERYPSDLVIGADTIVVFGKKVLGKPNDVKEARRMLRAMSGQVARVLTGFAIVNWQKGQILTDFSVGQVYFRKFSDQEINDYIKTGEPLGRAGAFAVQEKGAGLIEKVSGDFLGIVGLSQYGVLQALRKFGVKNF